MKGGRLILVTESVFKIHKLVDDSIEFDKLHLNSHLEEP